MLKNWNHDLVKQLSEVSSGLWRMGEYVKNAEGCDQCSTLWGKTKDHLEAISEMMVGEINRHSKENRFN